MSLDRYDQLLAEAESLKPSTTKTAILEEAVREAELASDYEAAYEARCEIIESATFSGEIDKSINAFSWCLAKYDAQEPYTCQSRAEFELLWRYKWILGTMVFFPTITRQQIASMEDDMRRRYAAVGYGLRTVYDHVWTNAMWMGDEDKMHDYYDRWLKEPRDGMTDCEACEVHSSVRYHVMNGHYSKAIRISKPIRNGKLRCRSAPSNTYGCLVVPALLLDRLDEAASMHKKGYRSIRRKPGYVWQQAEHLQYLVLLGDVKNALALVKRHLDWAAATPKVYERCLFYVGCQLACELGELRSIRQTISLPKTREFEQLGDQAKLPELAVWFRDRVDDMAAQFDARNDNDTVSQRLASFRELALERHGSRA